MPCILSAVQFDLSARWLMSALRMGPGRCAHGSWLDLDNASLPDSNAELGTGHWAAVTARPQKTALSVAVVSACPAFTSSRRTRPLLLARYGPSVLLCWLASVVCNVAGVRAGRPPARGRSGGRHCTAGQYGYVSLGRHLVTGQLQTLRHAAAG